MIEMYSKKEVKYVGRITGTGIALGMLRANLERTKRSNRDIKRK